MTERTIDVSQLEPCEPMERVLEAISTLQTGEYLHVLHRMEPHALYDILTRDGFAWLTKAGQVVPVEIYIWRSTDSEAAASVNGL